MSDAAYIREITDYFCSLTGKAGIISSEDKYTILELRSNGVSKEDVFLGIKEALKTTVREPKKLTITQCARFIRSHGGAEKPRRSAPTETHSAIVQISRKLAAAIEQTDNENVKTCLQNAQKKLSNPASRREGVVEFLEALREQVCAELIMGFDSALAERIKHRAGETIASSGRNFINENEKNKALAAFINDLVIKETGMQKLFSLEDM
ncbi:MAG: hypothetical protein GKS04_04375 [Candidatus Mycalebacterium zealandia]|nr:MAG: hypothetical protein GKS04_04375 [Candidatus Mycalebacterium zealandia]